MNKPSEYEYQPYQNEKENNENDQIKPIFKTQTKRASVKEDLLSTCNDNPYLLAEKYFQSPYMNLEAFI